MAISDYILCCKCEIKLLYDGDRSNREWWEDRWGKEPEIMCPDCEKKLEPVAKVCHDLPGHIGWNPRLNHLPDDETPLYIVPPQRKPLSDEELDSIIENWWRDDLKMKYKELARAIEAAYDIKGDA